MNPQGVIAGFAGSGVFGGGGEGGAPTDAAFDYTGEVSVGADTAVYVHGLRNRKPIEFRAHAPKKCAHAHERAAADRDHRCEVDRAAQPPAAQIGAPPADSDFAAQVFKDPYLFDFLATTDPRHEREVETSLVAARRALLAGAWFGIRVRRTPGPDGGGR